MASVELVRGAELPETAIWWTDRAGNLIDFSSGYTFTLKLGHAGSAAVHTKTTGITGAAGSGTDPTGTPNVSIAWAAGELDAVAVTSYTAQLTARRTSDSKDRIKTFTFTLTAEIS